MRRCTFLETLQLILWPKKVQQLRASAMIVPNALDTIDTPCSEYRQAINGEYGTPPCSTEVLWSSGNALARPRTQLSQISLKLNTFNAIEPTKIQNLALFRWTECRIVLEKSWKLQWYPVGVVAASCGARLSLQNPHWPCCDGSKALRTKIPWTHKRIVFDLFSCNIKDDYRQLWRLLFRIS